MLYSEKTIAAHGKFKFVKCLYAVIFFAGLAGCTKESIKKQSSIKKQLFKDNLNDNFSSETVCLYTGT